MFKIRKSESRGSANYGWLNTKYTFSFANYYDPNHMGFGSLIVINEDVIAAGKGFGAHGHDNMEILTYIISGSLEHKDSMGSTFVVKEGDVQRMSAGYGVTHSEFNHSKHKDVHLLQIWFKPDKIDIDPSYEQKNFKKESKLGKAKLIVSTNGDDNSLSINQKLNIYSSVLNNENHNFKFSFSKKSKVWLHMVSGSLNVNDEFVKAGDGIAIEGLDVLDFTKPNNAEIIIFEML